MNTSSYNNKHHGANFFMLQESLLHWIRNDNSMTIRLSTGDCNVTIDNALATPENYQVRWYVLRTCLRKKYMWIFEHNFVADKAKIRRRAVARQVFFTQYATKFAEKTRVYACEDRF